MLELHEIEELIKSIDRRAISAVLRNAAILKDPNATPEMKALAEANVKAIAQNKVTPKKSSPPPLDDVMGEAKQKMSEINNKKIQQNLTNIENAKSNAKADKAAERAAQRAAERKQQLLPGSEHTLKELQTSAARAERDPRAPVDKPVELRPQTTKQVKKQIANKHASIIENAIKTAHDLHHNGDTDMAHKILSSIPREHMPAELKHYNPAYIHYGITPDMWKANPGGHEDAHAHHLSVMNGEHDNSEHPGVKASALKVKNLLKPSAS